MITLAIETSTIRGGVAVLEDGGLIFHDEFTADRSHSSELFTILERALEAVPHCDQIAVGLGPGSYSGVRIAISAAIGLQYGLQAALVGIPSIIAMRTEAASYQAIGDARRGMFYYARIVDGVCVEEPALLTAAEIQSRLEAYPPPIFSSDEIAEFPSLQIAHPSAEKIARLAESGSGVCARDRLEPIYLREPHITTARTP